MDALWSGRVDRVDRVDGVTEPMLVRPDGYVCWAGPDSPGPESALGHWFGQPHRARREALATA
ncbi:aromatic-ring hydroxylase C-terminal domain-containing protein [Actinosynnema sp. ALI-1.44]|uniref:aromatic-ring hydroxylase C-terminal domain-containing protein n=1 Tax=Actinosynnema sp. ALI-1.44 TaxID=1933779 RepID=UPI003F8CFF04